MYAGAAVPATSAALASRLEATRQHANQQGPAPTVDRHVDADEQGISDPAHVTISNTVTKHHACAVHWPVVQAPLPHTLQENDC